jgi:hypothetical protein
MKGCWKLGVWTPKFYMLKLKQVDFYFKPLKGYLINEV